jgi:hypothetical protein
MTATTKLTTTPNPIKTAILIAPWVRGGIASSQGSSSLPQTRKIAKLATRTAAINFPPWSFGTGFRTEFETSATVAPYVPVVTPSTVGEFKLEQYPPESVAALQAPVLQCQHASGRVPWTTDDL